MSGVRMKDKQPIILDDFISMIQDSLDLKLEDKIKILEYAADECYIKEETLKYLECKLAIKELRDEAKSLRK